MSAGTTDARRRVKLYALNESRQWDDKGTGHVTSCYHEPLDGVSLLVRNESDGSLLLESRIQLDTHYQKQQGTLIVWTDSDSHDLALSFQEQEGCNEIWEKICEVQGRDPSYEPNDEEEASDISIDLVPCDVENLQQISEQIAIFSPTNRRREVLADEYLQNEYIAKLLSVFKQCEEKKDLAALHKLYKIFKQLFLCDKTTLIEEMLQDDNLMNVIGVFEYDPDTVTDQEGLINRKKHREYLLGGTKFIEVIPFSNQRIVDKIHLTYRVQYLQSSVLPPPSIIDENAYSTLTNILFFNKVEIVSMIQENGDFLKTLFSQIISNDQNVNRKRDLILFLKEFCSFSNTIQPKQRDSFFKTLTSLGILSAIEVALQNNDPIIKSAVIDIFTYLVEYSPHITREHAAKNFEIKDTVTDFENNEEEETDIVEDEEDGNETNECLRTKQLENHKHQEDKNEQLQHQQQDSESHQKHLQYLQEQQEKPVQNGQIDTFKEDNAIESHNVNGVDSDNVKTEVTNVNGDINILRLVIDHITHDNDSELGTATQLACILRLLLDPENMLGDVKEKHKFFSFFYETCMQDLVEPINAASQNNDLLNHRTTAQLLSIVLDLLSFFSENHQAHLRQYTLRCDLFSKIINLLKSRHTFLRLSVIKFIRRLVNAQLYTDIIVNENLFSPIIEVFKENQGRYNLLDSAILEMFEFLGRRCSFFLKLIDYTFDEFGEYLSQIEYVNTFKALKAKRDTLKDKQKTTSQTETNVDEPVLIFDEDVLESTTNPSTTSHLHNTIEQLKNRRQLLMSDAERRLAESSTEELDNIWPMESNVDEEDPEDDPSDGTLDPDSGGLSDIDISMMGVDRSNHEIDELDDEDVEMDEEDRELEPLYKKKKMR